jgi:cytochrome c
MMRRLALVGASLLLLILAAPGGVPTPARARGRQQPQEVPRFGFGRAATPAEINAWDIAVRPDGQGLPPGQGTARQGAAVYAERCAACHGASGQEGPFDRLVGREPRAGFPFGTDPKYVKTIGNYWPYATTLYDYINRAMPLNAPGSLASDQIYSLVAYLLWRNELIADTTVIDRQTLPRVVMPAHDRFVVDDRKGGAETR